MRGPMRPSLRALLAVPTLLALLVLPGCVGPDEPAPGADLDGDGFIDEVETKFGSDPLDNASLPDVTRSEAVTFSDTVQVVGTGVPSVQCPADMVNSQVLTWTVAADVGNATRAWVTDLVFEVTGAATVNDVDLFVTDPEGRDLGSGTGSTNAEAVSVRGERPLGDYTIEVRGCSGAGDVAVAASGTVHWIPSAAELLADG